MPPVGTELPGGGGGVALATLNRITVSHRVPVPFAYDTPRLNCTFSSTSSTSASGLGRHEEWVWEKGEWSTLEADGHAVGQRTRPRDH